MENKRQGRRKH